ncbi:MAG: hypothetical protein NVSMB31_04300 [Vulcanimicrobiaceae bacterium]
MAEIFGTGGETVEVTGEYECSQCGHRESFTKGATFPADHHPSKPWSLYLATEELPGQQSVP